MGYDLAGFPQLFFGVDTIQSISRFVIAMNFGNIYIKKVNFMLIFSIQCRYRIDMYVVEF